jgi:hypothetical protein
MVLFLFLALFLVIYFRWIVREARSLV